MEDLLHAVDSAMLGRWAEAREKLQRASRSSSHPVAVRLLELVTLLERAEYSNERHHDTLRAELGSVLAVAQSSVEGMIDGVLERDDARLRVVQDAVQAAGAILAGLGSDPQVQVSSRHGALETFTLCSLLESEATDISEGAAAKGIEVSFRCDGRDAHRCALYHGDAARVREAIRHALASAVRAAAPGTRIEAHCDRPEAEVVLEITDAPQAEEAFPRMSLAALDRLVRTLGGETRVESVAKAGTRLVIPLPAAPI